MGAERLLKHECPSLIDDACGACLTVASHAGSPCLVLMGALDDGRTTYDDSAVEVIEPKGFAQASEVGGEDEVEGQILRADGSPVAVAAAEEKTSGKSKVRQGGIFCSRQRALRSIGPSRGKSRD